MLLNKNPGMDPLSRECTEPVPSNAAIYVFQSSSPDLHNEALAHSDNGGAFPLYETLLLLGSQV